MFILLLLLFTVVPIVELALLIKLGQTFGLFATIAIVLGTGILGAALAKWQGLRAVVRVQQQLVQGILPTAEITDGLLILAAGLLLITPGALSDLAGLALLAPPVRALVRRGLARWFRSRFRVQGVGARFFDDAHSRFDDDDRPHVIEFDTRRRDETDVP